jgi:hypothetical protein
MITYEWNCKTVDVYPQEGENADVVYNVHWIVSGISDQLDPLGNPYSATNIGTQVLNTDDIADFVPFAQVTNEQVVIWTQTVMGAEQVASIQASISSNIEALINPTSITLTIGE